MMIVTVCFVIAFPSHLYEDDAKNWKIALKSLKSITKEQRKSFVQHIMPLSLENLQNVEEQDIDDHVNNWRKGEYVKGRGELRRFLKWNMSGKCLISPFSYL
jgi:hypothetical protein